MKTKLGWAYAERPPAGARNIGIHGSNDLGLAWARVKQSGGLSGSAVCHRSFLSLGCEHDYGFTRLGGGARDTQNKTSRKEQRQNNHQVNVLRLRLGSGPIGAAELEAWVVTKNGKLFTTLDVAIRSHRLQTAALQEIRRQLGELTA